MHSFVDEDEIEASHLDCLEILLRLDDFTDQRFVVSESWCKVYQAAIDQVGIYSFQLFSCS